MRSCPNCQRTTDDNAKFCDRCGSPIPSEAKEPYEPIYESLRSDGPTTSEVTVTETRSAEIKPEIKPPTPSPPSSQYAVQDSELWALMFALAGETPAAELIPRFKPELGVIYKIGEIEIPAARLKRLGEQEGILDSLGQVSFAICPKCESLNLTVLLKCPNCGKQTLSKSEMLIHYECGHLTPLHEIVQPGRTVYTCPKCGKLMRRVGIDYGRPGLAFTCPECQQVSQYPLVKLVCHNGHELKLDEPELRQYSVYRLGKGMSTIPRIITILNDIKAKLAATGQKSIVLANVTGESGNVYVTPLLVFTIPPLIADFILDKSTWEFQVIGAIRKTADLNARSLLIVRAELEGQVNDMINPKKIQVLTFEKEEEIVEKVVKAVDESLSKPKVS